MILESFHKAGTNPEDKDLLNINVTRSASSLANSFNIRGAILSRPMALLVCNFTSLLQINLVRVNCWGWKRSR